jgi:hypothetical protein
MHSSCMYLVVWARGAGGGAPPPPPPRHRRRRMTAARRRVARHVSNTSGVGFSVTTNVLRACIRIAAGPDFVLRLGGGPGCAQHPKAPPATLLRVLDRFKPVSLGTSPSRRAGLSTLRGAERTTPTTMARAMSALWMCFVVGCVPGAMRVAAAAAAAAAPPNRAAHTVSGAAAARELLTLGSLGGGGGTTPSCTKPKPTLVLLSGAPSGGRVRGGFSHRRGPAGTTPRGPWSLAAGTGRDTGARPSLNPALHASRPCAPQALAARR